MQVISSTVVKERGEVVSGRLVGYSYHPEMICLLWIPGTRVDYL